MLRNAIADRAIVSMIHDLSALLQSHHVKEINADGAAGLVIRDITDNLASLEDSCDLLAFRLQSLFSMSGYHYLFSTFYHDGSLTSYLPIAQWLLDNRVRILLSCNPGLVKGGEHCA